MFAKRLGLPTLSVEEVERLLEQRQVVVIDNNHSQAWAQGHVPGAIHLDPGDDTESDLPPDKNSTLVFYCAGPLCPMAPGAAKRAIKMGHPNVFVMSAGISGWFEKNKPVEAQQ
jgi:rhodanese-related sulfurtransferase